MNYREDYAKEAMHEGKHAARSGNSKNSHSPGSMEYAAWEQGWNGVEKQEDGMKKLIAELEAATVGSRKLDARIYITTFANPIGLGVWYGDDEWPDKTHPSVPHYTTSLVAARTLLPEGYEWLCRSDKEKGGFANVTKDLVMRVRIAGGQTLDESTGMTSPAYASTPELAFCIAALKARSQTNVGDS